MNKLTLEQNPLSSRNFLVQFQDIYSEFGQEIPWLKNTKKLTYILNEQLFAEKLTKEVTGAQGDLIDAYLLRTNTRLKEYIGGLLYFKKCPEKFVDKENRKIQRELTANGTDYISCLQVRESMQNNGYGDKLFKEALKAIFHTKGSVWGVVSHPKLLPWYKKNGAEMLQGIDNDDRLAIVRFESKNF